MTATNTNAFRKCLAALLLMLTMHGPSWACGAMEPGARSQFMVSAVLRREGPGVINKLVHAVETAGNADEAKGAFLRRVTNEHAGYSVLDTLVSELEKKSTTCVRRGTLEASAERATWA